MYTVTKAMKALTVMKAYKDHIYNETAIEKLTEQ